MIEYTLQPSDSERMVIETAERLARTLGADANHSVAAAAMDTQGNVYTGVNVYHFTGGPCAELVVLGVAASAGAGPLITLAAAGDNGRGLISPCGRCCQVLLDQHPDILVAVDGESGPEMVSIRDLLVSGYTHPDANPARVVRFDKQYFDDIQAGVKVSTVRWRDPIDVGPATFVFEDHPEHACLNGEVLRIQRYKLATLTAEEAKSPAGTDMDQFRTGLQERYTRMPEDAMVDVVEFRVL